MSLFSRAAPTLALLLLLCASGSAWAASAEHTTYPLAVTDDSGFPVVLPLKPVRIVSLTLPTDEILLSLVSVSRLAALTTLSADPGVSSVAALAHAVPRKMTLSVEPIVALHPDLVLAASWSDAGIISQLRSAGVPVFLIESPTTAAGVEALIERLALLMDEEEKGAALVTGMEAKLRDVRQRVSRIPPDRRLRVLDYTTFGASMGKGSSWDDVVRLAGLVNAVDEFASDRWGQVPLSTEELLVINPDILILPGWVYGDARGAKAFADSVRRNPALRGLAAVKTGRVYVMPENLRISTSQYIADAVEWLARTAYPEVFR